MLLLVAIVLLIVVDTFEVERDFSLSNRLQSFVRNSLKNKHLYALMVMCSTAPCPLEMRLASLTILALTP